MKRVVVTGLGVISSIGFGKEVFWEKLIAGTSGITEITSFDTLFVNNHRGGEIQNFDPLDHMFKNSAERCGRTTQLAIAAARLAFEDAGIGYLYEERTGVCLGTTIGEGQVASELNKTWIQKGVNALPKKLIGQYPYWNISRNVAIEFNISGPNLMIPTACAAGNYAIARASELIKSGDADIMLAGGTDSFSYSAFLGFNRLMSMTSDKVMPFDKNRKGMLIGEGAGILVLESLENALKRKALILAELIGYGFGCDAHHMTAPHPDGAGAALCMEAALKQAGIQKSDINYISAHGTGTPANDVAETKAIKKVFGDLAKTIPMSSIKSMLGHCMGAASAIEAVACCQAIQTGIIPPTINYETPDPDCDLDYVPNVARKHNVDIAMSNAFAFGGNDACILLRKYHG